MKLKCSYSGIKFEVSHFSSSFINENFTYHPIFDIPQNKLFNFIKDWSSGKMSETESYLYYLALLNSTEQLVWRDHARFTEHTSKIVNSNMELLLRCISNINGIKHPAFVLHKICIQKETADLSNSAHWIQNWMDSFASFSKGYKEELQNDKIFRRERAIENMIRNKNRPISDYARSIAQWAAMAGEFPNKVIKIGNSLTTLSEYWMDIIVRCCKADKIFQIPEEHLERLIEYCEENLEINGSMTGYELMKLLRSGAKKQKTYLGFDDVDFDDTNPGFKILKHNTSVEQANIIALVESAPKEKPIKENYPSLLAYLRDKVKYDQAQLYLSQQIAVRAIQEHLINDDENNEDREEIIKDTSSNNMQDIIEDSLIQQQSNKFDDEDDDDE